MKAAGIFASTGLSPQDLDSLLCMPWQKASDAASQHTPQHGSAASRSLAKINALFLQAASTVLGLAEVTATDFSSKQGDSGLMQKALQDPDRSVQAAAAVVLPVIVANTAEAAKGTARGQPIVGIRLLQKGSDSLSGLLQHPAAESALVKTSLAFAVSSMVSMQAIVEHRPVALCKAAQGLSLICQRSNRGSSSKTGSDAGSEMGLNDTGSISGLDCWPIDQRAYSQLTVTGHGGAFVPLKALKRFTDALLFNAAADATQSGYQGLHKVVLN